MIVMQVMLWILFSRTALRTLVDGRITVYLLCPPDPPSMGEGLTLNPKPTLGLAMWEFCLKKAEPGGSA